MPPPFTTPSSSVASRSTPDMSHIPVILAVTISTLALGASIAAVLILKRRSKTHDAFQMAKSPVNLNVDVSVDVYTVMSQDQVVEVPYSPAKEPLCITALPQNKETRVQLPSISPDSVRAQAEQPIKDLGLSLPEMSPCSPFMLLGGLYESSARQSSSLAEACDALSTVNLTDAPMTDMSTAMDITELSKSTTPPPDLLTGTVDSQTTSQLFRCPEGSSPVPEHNGYEDPIPSSSKAENIYGDDVLHTFVSMDVDALVSDYQSISASSSKARPPATPPATASHESTVLMHGLTTINESDDVLRLSSKCPSNDITDTALDPECRPVSESKEDDSHGPDELAHRPTFSSNDDSGYVDTTDALLQNTKSPSLDTGTPPSNRVQLLNDEFSFSTETKAGLVLPTFSKDDSSERSSDNVPRTPTRPSSCSAPPIIQTKGSSTSISSGSSMTLTTCYSRKSVRSQSPESSKAESPATVGRVLQPLFEGLASPYPCIDGLCTAPTDLQAHSLKSHLSISSLQSAFTLHSPSSRKFSSSPPRTRSPCTPSQVFRSPSARTLTPTSRSPASERARSSSVTRLRMLTGRIPGIITTRTPRNRQRSRSRTPTCSSTSRSLNLSCASPSASLYIPERPLAPTPGSFLSRLSVSPSTARRPFYTLNAEPSGFDSCCTTPRAGYAHSPGDGLRLQFPDMLASPYLRPSAPTPGSLRSRLSMESTISNIRRPRADSDFLGVPASPTTSYRTPSPSLHIPDSQMSTPLVQLSIPSSVQMSGGSFENFGDTSFLRQPPPSPSLSPLTLRAVSPLTLSS